MSSKPKRAAKVQIMPVPVDMAETGLPSSTEAERIVLGSILLDDRRWPECHALAADDFLIERHRQIWKCMCELAECGQSIDRLTVMEGLRRHNQFGSDGFGFINTLDEGMPNIIHLDSYVQILLNKSKLRRAIYAAQALGNACLLEGAKPTELLPNCIAQLEAIASMGGTGSSITNLPSLRECSAVADTVTYLHAPELAYGTITALTGDSGSGKSTLLLAWAKDISAAGIPVLVLDRDNPISVVRERYERLGIVDESRLKYWGGWLEEPPLPDDPEIIKWVKLSEPKPLVIVDCMIAFHGGDENDAAETRAFMRRCRKLADLGATVVVVHHDGKADSAKDYRGSSDFKAAIDAGFHLSNSVKGGRLRTITLRCFKSRFGFEGDLKYRYEGDRFMRDEGAISELQVAINKLSELLRSNPGVNTNTFDGLAKGAGVGRKTARAYLRKGVQSGEIRCEKGPKNANQYYLTEGRHARS